MNKQTAPIITTIDIETCPIVGDVWRLFDTNVALNQIKLDWSILSFTAKPLDPLAPTRSLAYRRKQCEYMDTSAAAGGVRDDSALVERLWQIFHESDIIVGQNVAAFDIRKIRARMIMQGLQPPSPCRVLDTLHIAKSAGAFTSNKLEYLSAHLSEVSKSKHNKFPGHSLWTECLANNPAAWAHMKKYNQDDVISTEEVYLKLRPWAVQHINIATYSDPDTASCPVCGSTDLHEDGFSFTNVSKYQRYHCGGCGAWSRSRYTLNSKATRQALLSK